MSFIISSIDVSELQVFIVKVKLRFLVKIRVEQLIFLEDIERTCGFLFQRTNSEKFSKRLKRNSLDYNGNRQVSFCGI